MDCPGSNPIIKSRPRYRMGKRVRASRAIYHLKASEALEILRMVANCASDLL